MVLKIEPKQFGFPEQRISTNTRTTFQGQNFDFLKEVKELNARTSDVQNPQPGKSVEPDEENKTTKTVESYDGNFYDCYYEYGDSQNPTKWTKRVAEAREGNKSGPKKEINEQQYDSNGHVIGKTWILEDAQGNKMKIVFNYNGTEFESMTVYEYKNDEWVLESDSKETEAINKQNYETQRSSCGYTYQKAYNIIKDIYLRHVGQEHRNKFLAGSDHLYSIPVNSFINSYGLTEQEKDSVLKAIAAMEELCNKYPGMYDIAMKTNNNMMFEA